MKIEISKTAFKALKKIDKKYQKIILEKIKLLENYPDTPNIKKLTNYYPPYRFRVGEYRILFDVVNEVVKIVDIRHRKEAY
jgi:mRNA interferase RelE/StbE